MIFLQSFVGQELSLVMVLQSFFNDSAQIFLVSFVLLPVEASACFYLTVLAA